MDAKKRASKSVNLLMAEVSFGSAGLRLHLGNASLAKVLMLGFAHFIIGDIAKALGAVASFPYLLEGAEKLSNNY